MKCKYPGCDLELDQRPYARTGIPSVTTVIDLANFDNKARRMSWAGAERAAVEAVHHSGNWFAYPTNIKGKPCPEDHSVCAECGKKKAEHDR